MGDVVEHEKKKRKRTKREEKCARGREKRGGGKGKEREMLEALANEVRRRAITSPLIVRHKANEKLRSLVRLKQLVA